jgi:hypothetical protein
VNSRREAAGTITGARGFPLMSEPLSIVIENAIQIAWDALERSGEITDPAEASQFLQSTIIGLVVKGERRRLMLSNKAIDAYRRHKDPLVA